MTSSSLLARRSDRLPLNLRLPNAPAIFVGRARELEALEAAIRRAPLTCVSGVGGLGKSALTFQVIHSRFRDHVSRTVVFRFTRNESIDQALLTVARTLADVQRVSGIDWPALVVDREALVAATLDLAEGTLGSSESARKKEPRAFWVIFDDLHQADPTQAIEVLERFARYARHSRWIMVGRTILLPNEALGQCVALGPMVSEDLKQLAQKWGFESGVDETILSAAAGSPWRLGQLVRGTRPGLEPGMGELLDGFRPPLANFLLDLAQIEAELSPEILASFGELPTPDELDALERRGLIERRPSGIRLHDVARGLLAGRLDEPTYRARRLAAAQALSQRPPFAAWLEGLRLFVREGEVEQAAQMLTARGIEFVEAGHILALWKILEVEKAPELISFRLYCATEMGDVRALRDIPAPSSPSPADRTRWALSLLLQGRYEEAIRVGIDAQQQALAAGNPELAFDAARIVCRVFMAQERYTTAYEAFQAQVPATPRQALIRDTDISSVLASLERRQDALALIEPVETTLEKQPALGDKVLWYGMARTLYYLGEVRRAERALARMAASIGGTPVVGLSSGQYLMVTTGIACDRGALPKMSDALEKLRPFLDRSPRDAIFVGLYHSILRLMRGPTEDLGQDIEKLLDVIGSVGRDDLAYTARMLQHRTALAFGEPPAAPDPSLVPNRTLWEDQLIFWEIIHRSFWARPEIRNPDRLEPRVPELQVLAAICKGWFALAIHRDPERARRAATQAAMLAADYGYGLLEISARECETLALLLSSASDAIVRESAAVWANLAHERGATCLEEQAHLLELVASPSTFAPMRLESIAACAISPVAKRWARALLGERTSASPLEELLIDTARRRIGCRIELVGEPHAAKRLHGWGIDERTQSVWLDNRICSLVDRQLLWRILVVIADAGGSADKEAIVVGAWGVREYHPLRDDARLHTAIRMLRKIIEDEPTNPARLVTTRQGYAFGSDTAVRRMKSMGTQFRISDFPIK